MRVMATSAMDKQLINMKRSRNAKMKSTVSWAAGPDNRKLLEAWLLEKGFDESETHQLCECAEYDRFNEGQVTPLPQKPFTHAKHTRRRTHAHAHTHSSYSAMQSARPISGNRAD